VCDERKRPSHHSKPPFGQGDDRHPRSKFKGQRVNIFAQIDHAAGATSVGPTELLIFGNPRAGTPLMQAKQTTGIDLPLKVLAWEDTSGSVWVTYNDPAWLAARHGLGEDAAEAVTGLARALTTFAKAAAVN
jgi:uncharacterized protein (DUF302 family)